MTEVLRHSAKDAQHDVDDVGVNAMLVERLKKQGIVDLEAGVVFGEDEGDGRADGAHGAERSDLIERDFYGGVVVTESGSTDGWRLAGGSGGMDVGAKRRDGHGKALSVIRSQIKIAKY